MKTLTLTLALGASVLLFGAGTNAADKETRKERQADRLEKKEIKIDIDQRIQVINRLDNNPAAMRAGMAAVSKETAVPLPTIEAEHKQHPKVGLAGLFMAHELAVHTHKPVDHFIRQRADGKTWNELAAANGQDLGSIDVKMTRVEQAMKDAK